MNFSRDAGLANRFAQIPRAFVHDGGVADLAGRDDGEGLSLLPVILLWASGYETHEAYAQTTRLSRLSGLRYHGLRRGRKTLEAARTVQFLPSPRKGVWKFRLSSRIQVEPYKAPRFCFPGRLFPSWRELTKAEKALLLVLGGIAQAARVLDVDDSPDMPDEVWDWVSDDLQAVESTEADSLVIRRLGHSTQQGLARLAGLHQWDVPGCLRRLSQEELVFCLAVDGELWFQLPKDSWMIWGLDGSLSSTTPYTF